MHLMDLVDGMAKALTPERAQRMADDIKIAEDPEQEAIAWVRTLMVMGAPGYKESVAWATDLARKKEPMSLEEIQKGLLEF